jgi:hypothetical protein
MRPFAACLCLLLVAACATDDPRWRDPTPVEWAAADFGDVPMAYDGLVRAAMAKSLKNPTTATYTYHGAPAKTWVGLAPSFRYGYGVCADITERDLVAKLDFGPYFFLFHDGRIIDSFEGAQAELLCARIGREPGKAK